MDNDANRLIDNLFSRIKEAEQKSGSRDADAESRINKHLVEQPSAPYYMAQTIIMQEAALKRLQAEVEQLKQQAEQQQPSSGGFLAGLFGGGSAKAQPTHSQSGWGQASQGPQPGNNAYSQPQPQAMAASGWGRGNSFLGGALQTAAGVAGGVVIGDMLMNMFSHHQPTEIVNIIDDRPMDNGFNGDMGQNDFANNDMGNDNFADSSFDNSMDDDNLRYQDAGFDQNQGFDGFDNGGGFDDFGGGFDDDSFF
ncbi:DUF2076 domain-containing protein [Gallaecimonas mangrovi]|uniref:DUF2076 domain-containing protein n=1 Tax=Gallaecimonas mangrovi TaxID=2291597 RepID=UPI000E2042C0|nr:DUF2076 domain-containing protein [Gallaecimonas mangrovi]